MKSVGEVMAIGRTFKESLGKALRSLEIGRWGFDLDRVPPLDELKRLIHDPGPDRLWQLAEALRAGLSIEEAHAITAIDPWFLDHVRALVKEDESARKDGAKLLDDPVSLARRKRMGMSDRRLMKLAGVKEEDVRQARIVSASGPSSSGSTPAPPSSRRTRRTCISTYETGSDAEPGRRVRDAADRQEEDRDPGRRSQPHRPGHRVRLLLRARGQALREDGYETIMVNCNPETVSTDYDTADRLYFEPLTREDVLEIIDAEKPEGVIVQFGGQTPLRLAVPLQKAGVKLLGTSADAIDRAEDRQRFGELVTKLGLRSPAWGTAHGLEERGSSPTASAIRSWCGRRTCSAGGPWRSSTTPRAWKPSWAAPWKPAARKAWPRAAARATIRPHSRRPVPARRHRGRRRRGGRRPGRGHRRRDGAHRGGRHSLGRLGLFAAALLAARGHHRGHQGAVAGPGARARRARPDERAVRGAARRPRHLHPGSESARLAHGAVRVQGHRRSPGQGGGQDRGGPHPARDGHRKWCPSTSPSKRRCSPS
jgi:hypothetical protein